MRAGLGFDGRLAFARREQLGHGCGRGWRDALILSGQGGVRRKGAYGDKGVAAFPRKPEGAREAGPGFQKDRVAGLRVVESALQVVARSQRDIATASFTRDGALPLLRVGASLTDDDSRAEES